MTLLEVILKVVRCPVEVVLSTKNLKKGFPCNLSKTKAQDIFLFKLNGGSSNIGSEKMPYLENIILDMSNFYFGKDENFSLSLIVLLLMS